MKFTKEQAVEKLNQELTNGGKKPLRMSAKTLESQVETLMAFVDDEMELDAFVEKVKGGLSSVNSNIEHDNSEFIKKYKEEHPDPKPNDPPTPPDPDPNDPNAAILKRLAELEAKDKARATEAAIKAKRAEIRKYLKDNNVTNDKWIDSMLGIATIGEEDNAEEKGKTYLDLYNASLDGGRITPPGTPKPGGGTDADSFKEVKDILKRRAESE